MISLQINDKMQKELDTIQEELGFSSRSEALRESIKQFILHYREDKAPKGYKIANITLHHEAGRKDILDEFSDLIQQYENLIKSISQYHLRNNVIKTLIVGGLGPEIHEFFHLLTSNRHFSSHIIYLLIPEKIKKD